MNDNKLTAEMLVAMWKEVKNKTVDMRPFVSLPITTVKGLSEGQWMLTYVDSESRCPVLTGFDGDDIVKIYTEVDWVENCYRVKEVKRELRSSASRNSPSLGGQSKDMSPMLSKNHNK